MPAPSRAVPVDQTVQYLTLPIEEFDEQQPNDVDSYGHLKTLVMQRSDTMPGLNVGETLPSAEMVNDEVNPEMLLLENNTHQNFK